MRSRLRSLVGTLYRTTETPAHTCLQCGRVYDAATVAPRTGTAAQAAAGPGDLSICIGCGALAQFDEGMCLRPFDPKNLDPEQLAKIRAVQAEIQRTHNRGN